jgi:proteasome lid subunit RPN8/RPN11
MMTADSAAYKVRIKQSDREAIAAYGKNGLPNEVCGLIAGRIEEEERVKIVEKVYFTANVDASREHFSIDPREQLLAVKDMRANGLVPLGIFHSHPETPARPSAEDILLAYDPSASYLILSLTEDPPVLKAFHIQNGIALPEEME